MVSVTMRHISGKKNILTDQLSCPVQILSTKWSPLPSVFDAICKVYGCPLIDLFAVRATAELPLHVSPVPDPMALKQVPFQHQHDKLNIYDFYPFTLLRQVLLRVLLLTNLSLIRVAPFWPKKRVVCRFSVSSGGRAP